MIRAAPFVLVILVGVAILVLGLRWAQAVAARRPRRRGSRRSAGYEFDRRRDQAKRRIKGVVGPERRDEILAFVDGHAGVEAYVEPKTMVSPLSVVLVDGAGEWRRFELAEDTYLRQLAAERGLPILDASRTGYPPRMRRRPPAGG